MLTSTHSDDVFGVSSTNGRVLDHILLPDGFLEQTLEWFGIIGRLRPQVYTPRHRHQ